MINQLHAYVCVRGYKAPKVRGPLRLYVYDLCDPSHPDLSHVIKAELALRLEEFAQKDNRVKNLDKTLMQIALSNPIIVKLMKIPGIGPLTATALLCEVGDFNIFDSGREFTAWLGLVPRQNTTGGKIKLGSITKAGNRYLRRLLIHCSFSLYSYTLKKRTPLKLSSMDANPL